MCGIAGWLSWSGALDAEVFGTMVRSLQHRGPDAEGIVQRGPVLLGHRRLSVIDPSAASHQPMADSTENYWIVFNGEIYNFKDIRRELMQHGVAFRTGSDTEVVLEAYKRWGQACVQKFNGMFAFALWDEAEQSLWLARDRMGEKPLFYMLLPDGVAFASELPALLAHPACTREVNTARLGHYLMLGYTTGEATLIKNMQRLPPANMMTFKRGKAVAPQRYWELAPHVVHKRNFTSVHQAADTLRALIDDSVKLRLVSDVSLGAFLSGGLDSSTIVASMVEHQPRAQVKAFTMGFGESEFDETAHASMVAEHLGVTHHTTQVTPNAETIERCLKVAAQDPLADTSVIPTVLLAEFTRQQVTVALSGDGGDECFAGYETYVADRLHGALSLAPGWLWKAASVAAERWVPTRFQKVGFDYKLKQFLQGMMLNNKRAHVSWRNLFTSSELTELVRPEWQQEMLAQDPFESFDAHFADVSGAALLDCAMYVDMKTWMADDILVKVDRASMAHGLESRAPFLDHRVVEFAASLPVSYKLHGFTKKHVLKLSQQSRLPREIIHRSKQGFNAPFSRWVLEDLKDYAYAQLKAPELIHYLRPQAIDKLWQDHHNRKRDNGFKLLSLVCLSLWLTQVHRKP